MLFRSVAKPSRYFKTERDNFGGLAKAHNLFRQISFKFLVLLLCTKHKYIVFACFSKSLVDEGLIMSF